MRKSFIPILISCLLLIPLASIAQQSVTSASGYVVDPANGDPVPYANVLFADSQIGTMTDENGYFSISNSQDFSTLVVMMLSYKTAFVNIEPGKDNPDLKIDLEMNGRIRN